MSVSISIEEQEFSIQASRDKNIASMYVTDRTYMTKLDKLVESNPECYKVVKVHRIDGDIIGKTYEFPKKLLSFRSGFVSRRELTEEEREQRVAKLQMGLKKWQEDQKTKVQQGRK